MSRLTISADEIWYVRAYGVAGFGHGMLRGLVSAEIHYSVDEETGGTENA